MGESIIKQKLLERLKTASGYLSGEELGKGLGVSRTMVWKVVRQLRQDGYIIDARRRIGYMLQEIPDLLLPQEFIPAVKDCRWGTPAEYYDSIISTNYRARELAEAGWPEGSIVVAEVQEKGKGRLGREWQSPRGGIWFSLILKPNENLSGLPPLSLLMAVAVARTAAGFDIPLQIKWPNDLLLNGRKVAGILTEAVAEVNMLHYVVVGCGINVNFKLSSLPRELQAGAGTILDYRGKLTDRVQFLKQIIISTEKLYREIKTASGEKDMLSQWKKYNCTLGREVVISCGESHWQGKAIDVENDGALIVCLDSGITKRFTFGEVTLRMHKA